MVTDLVKLGSQPIGADNSTGASVLYDPLFEQIKMEIGKLDSLHGGRVDWSKVLDSASTLLAEKSKDIEVAGYLCLALLQTQGYSGLSKGLAVYRDMVTSFWDRLYPELSRMRRRINAAAWLSERVGAAVARRAPGTDEKEAVHQCGDLVEELRELLDAKFGPDSPGLADLRSAIRDRVAAVGPLKPPVSEVKPSTPARPATAGATAASVDATAIASAEDAELVISSAKEAMRVALDFLREADLTNPLPYRLARMLAWGSLSELPGHRNGKTEIAGIAPPDLSRRFEESLDRGDWLTVLGEAETKFRETFFWLDAHRFVARAMEGLGPSFAAAQKGVREELAALVLRLPGLLDLQFRSGVPFADNRTRLWIESDVLPAFVATAPGRATPAAGETPAQQSPMDEAVQQAKRLVATAKLNEAIALFQKGLSSTSVRREQFRWKLHLAKLCLEAGRPQLAIPQLEFLDEEVHRFSLEEWEPALSLEVIQTLLACQHKLMEGSRQPTAEATERAEKLYARLCRMDALLALTLDGKK